MFHYRINILQINFTGILLAPRIESYEENAAILIFASPSPFVYQPFAIKENKKNYNVE
jgi:hypothetical protein